MMRNVLNIHIYCCNNIMTINGLFFINIINWLPLIFSYFLLPSQTIFPLHIIRKSSLYTCSTSKIIIANSSFCNLTNGMCSNSLWFCNKTSFVNSFFKNRKSLHLKIIYIPNVPCDQ